MVSEIDLRDWNDYSEDAYDKFIEAKGGEQAYGSEIWEAASIWAFEFLKGQTTIEAKLKEKNDG